MSAAQHTPGPWTAVKRFGNASAIVGGVERQYANGTAKDQLFMVNVVQDDNGGDEAQTANALLAAAAPELLEFAESVVAVLSHAKRNGLHLDMDKMQFLRDAMNVVAKATGSAS